MADYPSTRADALGAQGGDELCWSRLDERLRPWLMGLLAARRIPKGVDAEDVVNATLLKVFEGIARFEAREGSSFRKWVYTIMDHHLVDLHRIDRRQAPGLRSLNDSEAPIDPTDQTATRASCAARRREITENLHAALAKLPERTRRVMELRILNDMSFEEICKKVDLARAEAARLVYFRGKPKLHALMRKFDQ